MPKIAFMGAGSTVFAKNVLGDCMAAPEIDELDIALYDIDAERLEDSTMLLNRLNQNLGNKAVISSFLGEEQRRDALRDADYVVNAIQVGGYRPATVTDFEIPKKYGLRQTIGDTLGIGGIFRALRTIPVVLDFARDIEDVCPDAWFLNYVNPMAMITGALLKGSNINTVGLCHSVQVCAPDLLKSLDIEAHDLRWEVGGINHQAWLLRVCDGDRDLYPEVRRKAAEKNAAEKHGDMVRFEILKHFGYYVTESSEHNAEYMPYWIKSAYPDLIERFNIPLDEYPRRCEAQIEEWANQREDMINDQTISHERSHEYASYIVGAMESNEPLKFHGNVQNNGLISNLPNDAVVEVPCLADGNGVTPCRVGALPEQCAAMNRTNINVQLLTVAAALQRRKDLVYQAAMLDPHTAAELNLDDIVSMCDDLFEAHGELLPDMT